jgi:hypothetical protein
VSRDVVTYATARPAWAPSAGRRASLEADADWRCRTRWLPSRIVTEPAQPIDTFEEIGELLDQWADAMTVITKDYGPPWAMGSPAESDCQRDDALEGTPYLNTALMVRIYLHHAEDHVRAAARVTSDRNILMVSYTLARPALGSAARAMWLLDPCITHVERLRRGANLRMKALVELDNIAIDRDPSVKAQLIAQHRAAVDAIERDVETEGLPSVTRTKARSDGTRAPDRVGQPVPGDMALIRNLLDRDESEATADLIFRVASAFVHGEQHVINLLSRRISDARSAPGVTNLEVGVRLDNLAVYLASIIVGIHRMALATCAYAGWPDEVWQNMAQPMLRRWQATMHAAQRTAFRDIPGTEPTA